MRKKFSIGLGIVGIIALVAFQWAIIIKAPQQESLDIRASASTVDLSKVIIVSSVSDAYTSSSNPSANYGRESKMYTQTNPQRAGYIKFDLSPYKSAQLTSMTLRVRAGDSVNDQVVRIAPSSWDEYQINHANKPLPISSTVGKFSVSESSAWKEITLPPTLIQPYVGTLLTLILESTGSDQAKVYSRESAYPPQLLISTFCQNGTAPTKSSKAGDANGDGIFDAADPTALSLELFDNDGSNTLTCGAGTFKGATGADINRDGRIDAGDTTAMTLAISANTRAAYPGDVNGDSKVDAGDITALSLEINDADGSNTFEAGKSTFAGTLGSDVNRDGVINQLDIDSLKMMILANTKPSLLGDVNGDGYVTRIDLNALNNEIFDGDGSSVFEAGKGTFAGAFGADVNQDLKIDAGDISALSLLLGDGICAISLSPTPPRVSQQTQSSKAGDVNGDGILDAADPTALSLELFDGDDANPLTCGAGSFKGATGTDINRDGKLDAGDTTAMALAVGSNTKAAYPGDVNGDVKVDAGDITALALEMNDSDGSNVFEAGKSEFSGTLGSDVDGNTLVNDQDMNALKIMIAANTAPSLLGDANGDGRVSREDMDAVSKEIYDGDGTSVFEAGKGTFRGAFGADVNQDLKIDAGDISALSLLLGS